MKLINDLPDVYLDRAGSLKMKGDLHTDQHRIKNLLINDNPQSGTDVVNKNYVDSTHLIKPSHQENQFSYLMSDVLEWTDLVQSGNSFNMTKIDNKSKSQGNFHSYNRKVIDGMSSPL